MRFKFKQSIFFFFFFVFITLSAHAHPFWVEGIVTREPYKDKNTNHTMIEVDKKVYWIISGINIRYRYETSQGNVNEDAVSVSFIRKGQKINMLVAGKEINEIILY